MLKTEHFVAGIEAGPEGLKVALIAFAGPGKMRVQELLLVPIGAEPAIPQDALIVSGLDSREVLIRTLTLKLKKRALEATIPFQIEPLLPCPLESVILAKQILGDTVTVFAAAKSHLQAHLETQRIEPEQVSCTPAALLTISKLLPPIEGGRILLHLDRTGSCALLISGESLVAVQPISSSDVAVEAKKILCAWESQQKQVAVCQIVLTGPLASPTGLISSLQETLGKPVMQAAIVDQRLGISPSQLQTYAVALGLALGAHPDPIDFRQHELAFTRPWSRFKRRLTIYATAVVLFSIALYAVGEFALSAKQNQMNGAYEALFPAIEISLNDLEKGSTAHLRTADELSARLNQLEKAVQDVPETFPLHPDLPRVGDLLAWLANRPAMGTGAIKVQSLTYALTKRPDKAHPKEHYQVKVDLEFTADSPTVARDLHEQLIAANPFVDISSEVKWGNGKGSDLFKASFFLRDRTKYPDGKSK